MFEKSPAWARLIGRVRKYRCAYENYASVLIRMAVGIDKTIVKPRRGPATVLSWKQVPILALILYYLPNMNLIYLKDDYIVFMLGQDVYRFRGWELLSADAFADYDRLEVEERRVLDIGASVGDSAIRFAKRGAKFVLALEPHPTSYRLLEENVRLNGVEKVVEALHAGSVPQAATSAFTWALQA
jgi:hypothetical protein